MDKIYESRSSLYTAIVEQNIERMSDEHFLDRYDVHYDEFADAFNAEMHFNATVYNRRVKIMHRGGTMNDVVCCTPRCTYKMR